MKRTRYKFMGRIGSRYVWHSILRLPGDSRIEEFSCGVDWFWRETPHPCGDDQCVSESPEEHGMRRST